MKLNIENIIYHLFMRNILLFHMFFNLAIYYTYD